MRVTSFTRRAIALLIALTLSATARAGAQTDTTKTTKRAVSQKRIPIRKDQVVKEESTGDVALAATSARVDALDNMVSMLRERITLLERENATLGARSLENERLVKLLRDSLTLVSEQLATERAELTTRMLSLEKTQERLDQRLTWLRNGTLFGKSGFYVGAATGATMTLGTLNDIGYDPGLNVSVPIGWSKPDQLLGVRTEWAVQTLQGRLKFGNVDPVIYTGTALLTLNLPLNVAKTNLLYLMGGGGVYHFRDVGQTSMLVERLGSTTNATKWGVTAGAGLELHVLGPTSLFVESAITNIFAERPTATAGRNLRWVPLLAGVTLR